MKVLAIARPRAGVDVRADVARHAREELRALWELYREGSVRELYSPGGPGAVLILEAGGAAEAESLLATLPLVANRVMEFEVIELRPFAALGMLFGGGGGS